MHQCCGNPLEPTVPTRRVANVRWGGADLAAVARRGRHRSAARGSSGRTGSTAATFAGNACDWYRQGPAAGAPLGRRRPPCLRGQRRTAADRARFSGAPCGAGLFRHQQRQVALAAAPRRPAGRGAIHHRLLQRQRQRRRYRGGPTAAPASLGDRAGIDHRGAFAGGGPRGGRTVRNLGLGLVVPRHHDCRSQRRWRRELCARGT